MNIAMAIITHALRMLVHDPATTLRVLAPAVLVVMGSSVAAVLLAPEALTAFQAAPDDFVPPPPSTILTMLVLGIIGLLGYALMAILWHRHVLLSGPDRDTALRPGGDVVLGYVWRAIVVGFAQFLVAIPIGIALTVVGLATAPSAGGIMAVIFGVLAGVVFVWVALRLSVVLPAAALGNTMRIAESWQTTAPIASALWGVAVMLALINLVITLVSSMVLPADATVRLVFDAAIYICEGLIFVSVLTTLYGHLVEDRPLG